MLDQLLYPAQTGQPFWDICSDLWQNLNATRTLCCVACMNCGAPVPGDIGDKHQLHICRACHRGAVNTMTRAKPVFGEILQWIGAQGLQFHNLKLRLELRTRVQLATLGAKCDFLGITLTLTQTINHRLVSRRVNGVAIMRGLPDAMFRMVTVHELGHAWLAVQQATGLPPWQEEGFCQLLAHRYLLAAPDNACRYQALCIERQKDDVYGVGFLRIRSVLEKKGFSELLRQVVSPWPELVTRQGGIVHAHR